MSDSDQGKGSDVLDAQDRTRFEQLVLPHLDAAFNLARWLLRSRADSEDVTQELFLPREQWFVLKAKRPGASARALAKKYGLEELRDYLTRSRHAIDKMRGRGLEGV